MVKMLLAMSLLLASCAQYQWQKSGATQAGFKQDTYECEKDMRQSGYFGGGLLGAYNAYAFGERCMEARGYTKIQVR